MSNGYRNGAFALGLVVGGGLTLNLILWLDYRTRQLTWAQSETSQDPQYSEVGKDWDGLIGTFISPSDSLAQWIMAFFTIAATVILVLTLRSANKTNQAAVKASQAALRANEIMQQEQRPWVTLERDLFCDFLDKGHGCNITWNYNFSNRGKSPASTVRFHWKVTRCDKGMHDAQLVRDFADECIKNPKFFHTPLIFPGDSTDFVKYGSRASFTFDNPASSRNEVRILVCLTYELHLSGGSIGVEARSFGIECKDRFGPFSAKVLEHSYARLIK